MQLLHGARSMKNTKASRNQTGLVGWMLGFMQSLRAESQPVVKQMHLLETLPLGGKRQLVLVSCGGERFLVGGSLESIETIVRIQGEVSPGLTVKKLDGTCF